MSKGLRCSKCGARCPELYSPEWTCLACVSKDVLAMYPAMKAKVREKQEKGKQ